MYAVRSYCLRPMRFLRTTTPLFESTSKLFLLF